MKKLLLAFVISIATSFGAKAQTQPFNKKETLDYINKTLKTCYTPYNISHQFLVSVEGRILSFRMDSLNTYKYDLVTLSPLNVYSYSNGNKVYAIKGNGEDYVISPIEFEYVAIRLKKALEHLIELVKTEKSTDPFDN